MKKILLLPAYYYPEHAASSYLGENCFEAFTEAGYSLKAYAPTPCRGISEEVRKEYQNRMVDTFYDGKMILHRFPMYAEGKNPLLRSVRYSLCWLVQCWKGLTEKNVDCIYLASTPPIQGMIGSFVKKFRGVPFVYNLQDIFPDSLFNNGLANKDGLLWKIGRMIEDFTYKHADKIIVISEDFKRNIMAKGVPEEKIVVVYNWVDQNAVVDIPREKNKLFDMYGLNREKFYVSYNGNIGLSQNLNLLLNVADEFNSNSDFQNIHFVLVGEGAYLNDVKRIIKEKKLNNIHLIPFQPYEDISYVFSLGDVSLVISKPGTGVASVPSKTWSIMSASRPVLANFDRNELEKIISINNCGIFTQAGDKAAFISSIITLYHNRELAKKMGKNGRSFVMKNLTREVGVTKYLEVIKSVVKNK